MHPGSGPLGSVLFEADPPYLQRERKKRYTEYLTYSTNQLFESYSLEVNALLMPLER